MGEVSDDLDQVASSAAAPALIVLVHGTGATGETRIPSQWWKADSEFSQRLLLRVGRNFQIWGSDPSHKGFDWCPGPNLESVQRLAGARLLQLLRNFELDKRTYHLVGHSHGGSVIWHALRLATSKNIKLDGLKSWSTVGTPFLEFRPSRAGLWEAIALLLCALTIGLTISFFGFAIADVSVVWHELGGINFLLTVVLTTVVVVLIFVLSSMVLVWVVRLALNRRGSVWDLRAGRAFQNRWFAIWHSDDEPIVGLKASMSFPPELTPRFTTKGSFWLRRIVFAPYDLFLARSGDEYAWRLLMRRLQGADLRALDLVEAGVAPWALRPWPSLSPTIEAEIRSAALRNWPQTLQFLHARLNAVRASGNGAMLLDALPPDLWSCTIHNSYFENDAIVDLIAGHLVAGHQLPMLKRARETAPPLTTKTWLTAWTMGIAAITALFCVAAASVVAPLTRNYQVNEIVSRVKRHETLAVQSSAEVGALLVRLSVMDKLGDPAQALALIVDPTTASLAAQQLAYSYAHAGKFSAQILAALSDHLGEGTGMDGRVGKAAVLVQAVVGAARAKQPVDLLLKQLEAVFHDGTQLDDRFFDTAVNSLVEIGHDETAKDLLASQAEGKSWCEPQAEKAADSPDGDKAFEKKIIELCRTLFPSADLDPHPYIPPSDTPETEMVPVDTAPPDTVSELAQLVRSHQANAAEQKLKGILYSPDDASNGPARNERAGFFKADLGALISLMTAFREEKDSEAAYWIVTNLLLRVSPGNHHIEQIAKVSQKLIESHFDQELRRFAEEQQKRLDGGLPASVASKDSSTEFWGFGETAVVFYVLGEISSAQNDLQRDSERLEKSSGDTDSYRYAIELGQFFRWLDYGVAHKFFELARSIVGKNPLENSRSSFYGELAWYFANLGDYKTARETAERAGSLVVEGDRNLQRYSGILGGYEAILDIEIARRFWAKAKELGVTRDGANLHLDYTFEGWNPPNGG